MPKFNYKAKSELKPLIEGSVEAESLSSAVKKLSAMGYFPLNVEREGGVEKEKEEKKGKSAGLKKVPAGQISISLRQLSDLLNSGVPLASALKMTAEQTSHKSLKNVMESMAAEVRAGKSLSEVMEKYSAIFPPFFTQIVHAGEVGGMLGQVLERLADDAERDEETKSHIKAALAYPAFIVVVGIFTIAFLLCVIIPRLASMFTEFQQMLPLPTRILLGVSHFFRTYGWGALIFIALSFMMWEKEENREKLSFKRDQLVLKIPVIKVWVLKREIAHFARTLGSLLENGVPILQSLHVSIGAVNNKIFRQYLLSLQDKVREGMALSKGLETIPVFPPYVCNLIAVGEEGGKLDKALIKIADSYDLQARRELKVAVSLLEPALILFIGIILGSIVISIMLPIFEINTLIH